MSGKTVVRILSAVALVIALGVTAVRPVYAQGGGEKGRGYDGPAPAINQGPRAEEIKEGPSERMSPEVEAVASGSFRSVSYVQPLVRRLNFEGHYFGTEGADVGEVGASWGFRFGPSVVLSPGFGVLFGSGEKTGPAFTFRWAVEKSRFVSEGLLVQALRKSDGGKHDSIWDGNHASVRWKRLTVGPSWEHLRFREEDEWKWGGRAAFRLARKASFVLYVLAPGRTEFRGGVILHTAR